MSKRLPKLPHLGLKPSSEMKKEAKTVCIEFGENTTAHGVPRISKSRSYRGYIFWTCVFILCVIVFVVQATFLMQRFLRYETSTQIELKFEPVAFPAITICNINPYKQSLVLNENSLQRMLTSFDRALTVGGTKSAEIDRASRNRRQLGVRTQGAREQSVDQYRPVYAHCRCPDDHSAECQPVYESPPKEAEKPQCVCFYHEATGIARPCYKDSFWHLTWCDCSMNRRCKPAEIQNIFLIDEHEVFSNIEPCLCSNVTTQCIATFDKRFEDLWKLPPRSTTTETPNTTESTPTTEVSATTTVDPYEEAQSFDNMTDPAAIAVQGRINLMFAIANMSTEQKMALSHQKEDLIRMCVFNRQQCDIDRDFRLHVDPMYGNCYVFNYDARFNKTNRAGPVFGLRLMLYLDVKEYMPLTQELGARIAVHTADNYPFPDVFGYNAPAGITSSFGIRLKRVKRLEPPYGNCTYNAKAADYIYENSSYSTEGCYRTCRQRALLKNCSCGEPRFPVPTGARHCGADDPVGRKCLENAVEAMGSVYGNIPDCNCPQPCEQAVYDASYSAAKWPSGSAHPSMLNCSGTIEECTKHLRENGAAIEIYFEQLNCEYLKESEAYPFVNLLADLGGQLGLWLGFSLITVIEIAVFVWDLIRILCCRRRPPPPPPPPQDQYSQYNGDIYGPVSVECTMTLRSNSVY